MSVSVLVVDDSALIRGLLTKLLGAHPDITVIGCAEDAQDARAKIKALDPDVVTLDIEMPGMDGISFLEKIMTLRPTPVVMISTLTQKGAQVSLRALQLGAFDVFPKPLENLEKELENYREILQNTVIGAATANVAVLASRARRTLDTERTTRLPVPDVRLPRHAASRLIAIGASTGGTEAICRVLEGLPGGGPAVVITQHIPEAFCASFAQRLDACSPMSAKVAEHGEQILPGHIYLAPGDAHLAVVSSGAGWSCRLDTGERVNRHRPAVDVLFNSVAECAGRRAIGCLLTGMGKDGAAGLLSMQAAGARTFAQDEATSVVWGMPGSAVKLGAADEVVPLDAMANSLLNAMAAS